MIRLMQKKDCWEVAKIHKGALKGDYLPTLGFNVLKTIYIGLLKDKESFGYVVQDNKKIAGFITGSENTKDLFKKIIKKEFFSLSYHVLVALIKNPLLISNLIQTFKYNKKAKTDTKAELISIALKKEYRGKDLGSKLTKALTNEMARRDINKIKVTVNKSNTGANKFYQKRGFRHIETFIIYNKEMNLYTLEI